MSIPNALAGSFEGRPSGSALRKLKQQQGSILQNSHFGLNVSGQSLTSV
jgi:hypothetical protein